LNFYRDGIPGVRTGLDWTWTRTGAAGELGAVPRGPRKSPNTCPYSTKVSPWTWDPWFC